jgi:hypothetical protein
VKNTFKLTPIHGVDTGDWKFDFCFMATHTKLTGVVDLSTRFDMDGMTFIVLPLECLGLCFQ